MKVFSSLSNIEEKFDAQDLILLMSEPKNQQLEQLESLEALHCTLEGYTPEEQIKTLGAMAAADKSVRAIVGFDEDQYMNNFNQMYEIAIEGFWQDFLRWGIFGALVGQYLQSLGRIRKCCKEAINDGIDQNKMNNWTARSLYLPDASEFFKALDGLQALYDAMTKASKNLDGFEPSQLFDKLKGTGISCTEKEVNGVKKIDWKAIGGSFLATFATGFIQGFAGPASIVGTIAGLGTSLANTIGAHKASDRGGKLGQRGWNANNMTDAAKRMIKMVEQAENLKGIQNKIDMKSTEAKKEYGYKIEFLNKCGKVYLEDIKEIGRGLASAIYHVKK